MSTPQQQPLPFADGPRFGAKPKARVRLPAKRKGWRISAEALETLRTMKTREKARQEAERE